MSAAAPIDRLTASAYTVPLGEPESDGTAVWDATTLVLVEAEADGETGLGYTYADASAAHVIAEVLCREVMGRDAMHVEACWQAMVRAVRNAGRPGIASHAVSAVDAALWDLKAKLLGLPLVGLLGAAREAVPAYGSGGFTSRSDAALAEQLRGWVADGFTAVKMKVGREPSRDVRRVEVAREAVGDEAALFVDANGGYDRKEALAFAEAFAGAGVTWFEEPVWHTDLAGLRLVRDRAPAGMAVACGEYGYTPDYFRRMLDAGAVDVLMADGTRCGGVTGLVKVAALCEAHHLPLSLHTAPALHASAGCALAPVRHVEHFADHARVERRLFDGAPEPEDGRLRPDPSHPGLGLTFKHVDAERYRVFQSTS